jgi:hypothetical protein
MVKWVHFISCDSAQDTGDERAAARINKEMRRVFIIFGLLSLQIAEFTAAGSINVVLTAALKNARRLKVLLLKFIIAHLQHKLCGNSQNYYYPTFPISNI